MARARFAKVKQSKKPLYGPRCILVCGCPPASHDELLALLADVRLGDCPVVFASDDQRETRLADLLSLPGRSGYGRPNELPPAVILSGVSERELHRLMNAWRARRRPAQLWATLTPTSERWTLGALLEELAAERAALAPQPRQAKRKPGAEAQLQQPGRPVDRD